MVKARVREVGGRISFRDLAEWAKDTEIGSLFVLYAIVKDMIDQGELVALEGYEELPELMMWQAPKVVALPEVAQEIKPKERKAKPEEAKIKERLEEEMSLEEYGKILEEEIEKPKLEIDIEKLDEDLKKALSYLSEYWSVGEIRFKLDLKKLGIQDPDKVLYKLLDMDVIDLTPGGVVNLKVELPKIKKKPSLIGFI